MNSNKTKPARKAVPVVSPHTTVNESNNDDRKCPPPPALGTVETDRNYTEEEDDRKCPPSARIQASCSEQLVDTSSSEDGNEDNKGDGIDAIDQETDLFNVAYAKRKKSRSSIINPYAKKPKSSAKKAASKSLFVYQEAEEERLPLKDRQTEFSMIDPKIDETSDPSVNRPGVPDVPNQNNDNLQNVNVPPGPQQPQEEEFAPAAARVPMGGVPMAEVAAVDTHRPAIVDAHENPSANLPEVPYPQGLHAQQHQEIRQEEPVAPQPNADADHPANMQLVNDGQPRPQQPGPAPQPVVHNDNNNGNLPPNGDDNDETHLAIRNLIRAHSQRRGAPNGGHPAAMHVNFGRDREGVFQYERLQGSVVLFTATSEGSYQFILQAIIAAKMENPPFPFNTAPFVWGVTLCRDANSDVPLRNARGYDCCGLLMYDQGESNSDRPSSSETLNRYLQHLVQYCNTHGYSKREGLVTTSNFISYRARRPPEVTRSPKRKVGDVCTLGTVINFLHRLDNQLFNETVYQTYPNAITSYFSAPYNFILQNAFGLPAP
jgi:hypothetical protein